MVTDPLTERARAFYKDLWITDGEEHNVKKLAAFGQSEREAAEERLEIEAGEAYERGVQSGLKLCEAAAAEARRAALEEAARIAMAWHPDKNGHRHPLVEQIYELRSARVLASPAPQEETR